MYPFRQFLFLALTLPAPLLLPGAEPAEDAEKLARDLVSLRVEAARAEASWRTERELLASTVAALQEKAVLAEEKMDLTRARTAKDREEVETMRARVQGASDDLKALETRLTTLTARLAALRPGLPPRLSQALEMSYRTMADPGQPSAERLRQAMNALNRCAQFNRLVTSGEEVLTIDGEANAKSYEVIYWGLSHGYAVDRTSRKAWMGSPKPGGWQWESRPEAFDHVAELLAVSADKADPAFVLVPVTVPKISAEPTRGRTQ